jgi:tetratricopeptide (TPR) repeat protein
MTRRFDWHFIALFCAIMLGAPQSPAAEVNDELIGREVTVIKQNAKLISNNLEAGSAEIGDSFFVEAVKGDLLLLRSRNVYLSRSDAVPYEEAIEYLTSKIREDASAFNYDQRGRCWERREKFDLAIGDFTTAIRLEPKNAGLYVDRGLAWKNKNELDKALADYNEAIRLDPKQRAPYNDRGVLFCLQGEFDKGISDFNKAIEIDANNSTAFANRGQARIEKRELAEGLTDLGVAIRLDPQNLDNYIMRAEGYLEKGDYDKALLDLKELVRLDRATGLNNLAWYRSTFPDARFRDGEQAVRDATEACEIAKWKSDAFLNTLSAALAETGQYDEAIKRLQQSIDLNPDYDKEEFNQMMKAFKAGQPYRHRPSR